MERLAVSVSEAARLLSISKSTFYRLVQEGKAPAIRVTEKRLIVPVAALQAWLQAQREGGL